MNEKDLEDEIGDLVKQKQELWMRRLTLEKMMEEMQGSQETIS